MQTVRLSFHMGRTGRLALASALAALALPAGAARAHPALVGTQPPGGADRAGLTRAFRRAHHGDPELKLVGFRIYLESPRSGDGAAYYLTQGGPQGGYARGDFEYYHRVGGHRWRRVRSLPRGSEDNLQPAYLWRVQSTGSGSATTRTVVPLEEEGLTATDETVENFAWKLRFGHAGEPFIFGYPGGDRAPPGLTGTVSYLHTDGIETNDGVSCTGTFTDGAVRSGWPSVIGRETRHRRDYDIELRVLGDESLRYSWTSIERPPGGDGECVGAYLPGAELVFHARTPVRRFEGRVASFRLRLGGLSEGDGEPEGTALVASVSGTLDFIVMGISMPHGLLGAPDDPDPEH